MKRLRLARGLTTTELAYRARVSEGSIRALEIGQIKAARFVTGVLLADALGVTARYLALGKTNTGLRRQRTSE